MPQVNRFIRFISASLASVIAMSAVTANRTDAQVSAAEAYRVAQGAGTVEALEDFIENYPLSSEANDAFAQIVARTRGSVIQDDSGISRGIGIGTVLGGFGSQAEFAADPY